MLHLYVAIWFLPMKAQSVYLLCNKENFYFIQIEIYQLILKWSNALIPSSFFHTTIEQFR